MNLEEDTHLCLRCGKTVEGLDNYVSHRQQRCQDFQPPINFLSETLTSVEPQVDELQTVFPQDIYKLSANDFFLSLNLQSNFKSTDLSNEIQRNESNGFCSKLEISPLESDLANVFGACQDSIDEHECVNINNVIFPNERSNEFKNPPDNSNYLSSKQNTIKASKTSITETLIDSCTTVTKEQPNVRKYKKKVVKQYNYSDVSKLNVPRTSYRQKLNANDSLLCCQGIPKYFTCLVCSIKFSFIDTFLDHLLVCCKKFSNVEFWMQEMFKNQLLFVHSMHFKCLLCSFYCSDSFVFLEHLRNPLHRQNAASRKNPLICLPCRDECSASDEIKDHFSKNHLEFKKGEHPVIITEKKKNSHCCYCLTLIKGFNHIQSNNKMDTFSKADITFIKSSLLYVCTCSYGVDKEMFNSYFKRATSLESEAIESKCDNVNEQPNQEPEKNVFKNSLQEESSPSESEEADNPPKRLIAKITTKNGKLIYSNLKKTYTAKLWICLLCGSKHVTKISLELHKNVCKSKEDRKICKIKQKGKRNRKFLCDKCPYVGKCFNQLTRHSRSHSGEKPFKCPHCQFSSSQSSQMVRHKRLHTGDKPYRCPYCEYATNNQENLRKHILATKKHKGKMMYPCRHCDYRCNDYSVFKEHVLECHPKQFPKKA